MAPRYGLSVIHFFLKPVGHTGFTAVNFFVIFPFTQMMVAFFIVATLSATILLAAAFSDTALASASALSAAALSIPKSFRFK